MGTLQKLWELFVSKPLPISFALLSTLVAWHVLRDWFARHRTREKFMLRVRDDGHEFQLPVDEVTTTAVHQLVEFTSYVRADRKRREREHAAGAAADGV